MLDRNRATGNDADADCGVRTERAQTCHRITVESERPRAVFIDYGARLGLPRARSGRATSRSRPWPVVPPEDRGRRTRWGWRWKSCRVRRLRPRLDRPRPGGAHALGCHRPRAPLRTRDDPSGRVRPRSRSTPAATSRHSQARTVRRTDRSTDSRWRRNAPYSPNQGHFPSTVLRPGELSDHRMAFQFWTS
jgi:hypothetical protein